MAEKTRLEMLRELYARDPKDGFVAYGLAMELQKKPATEAEALKVFQNLVEDSASYLPTYFQVGVLLRRRGEPEEARKAYKQGITLASQLGELHTKEELEAALGTL